MDGLLEPEVAARLANARAGGIEARDLRVADLRPGDCGVLHVTVVHVEAPRTFHRRGGGSGTLCRVALADASGEVDLVLWGEEVAKVRDGTLCPGAAVVLRGAAVKDGWKGGVELGLGSAVLEPGLVGQPDGSLVQGLVVSVGRTNIVGEPPAERFNADLHLETGAGPATVVVWDALVPQAKQLQPGDHVAVAGVSAHPALDGWWVADGGASLTPSPSVDV